MNRKGERRAWGQMICVFFFLCSGWTVLGEEVEAQEPRGSDAFERVSHFIQDAMNEEGIPSVAVAVAKDGEILWEEAFGWADRENRVSATPHTIYSLASISKTMTATGLMILVEEGVVDLDAPVNNYLGRGKIVGLGGDASEATVRRVLTHTAGLPLHFQFVYEDGDYSLPSMGESISRYGIVVNPPGEVYQYSNIGFGILDQIIARNASRKVQDYLRSDQRIIGMSFADFMRTRVFLPLDLSHTSIGIGSGLEQHVAVRYDDVDRRIPYYHFDHDGASQAWSSAHDLIRFGMFHLKNRLDEQVPILNDTTLNLMQQSAIPDRVGMVRALGWSITEDDHGYRRLSHGGGMPGVRTTLNLYPSADVAVAVLTNKTNSSMSKIAEELAAVVLPGYEESLREQRNNHPSEDDRVVEPHSGLVGEWSGTITTWQEDLPLSLTISEDKKVFVKMGGQLKTVLSDLSMEGQHLVGRFDGTIPTPDANRRSHQVLLNLRLRGDRLAGQASAHAVGGAEDPVQTSYGHYILTSYADLMRDGS